MKELFEIFDSWEPILKARKPKGLHQWDKLQKVADKLSGKHQKDITFTCGHPDHAGATHVLGSTLGNLHFLMGYVSPAFHMAPYHWMVIDPSIDEDQAEDLYLTRGHPSRPELFALSGLALEDEGDVKDGEPHETVASEKEEQYKKDLRESEGVRVKAGAGTYFAMPSEQLIYGEHNDHVYSWDLARDSFLAAAHPEVVEKMAEFDVEDVVEEEAKKALPAMVVHRAKPGEFADTVYPLVKSKFPVPGTLVPLVANDDVIYASITPDSVEFYNSDGYEVSVPVYGRLYKSLDLSRQGDTHPSIIYNFATNYLFLDREDLEQYVVDNPPEMGLSVVKGTPSPGWEDAPDEYVENLKRSVALVDGTYRAVYEVSK